MYVREEQSPLTDVFPCQQRGMLDPIFSYLCDLWVINKLSSGEKNAWLTIVASFEASEGADSHVRIRAAEFEIISITGHSIITRSERDIPSRCRLLGSRV